MQPEQQIRHTQRSLRRIEREADKATRLYLRSVRQLDRWSLPIQFDLREFWDVVRDAMLLVFQEGWENRPIGKVELAWSPFRRSMWKVENFIRDEGLGRVVDDFGTRALQELGRANRSLSPWVNRLLRATTNREVRVALNNLLSVADARLKTVIRTATHTALSSAHYLWDQQPGVRDEIWGYEYVTMEDERVREEHWAMHGVIQPKEHPIWDVWWPPNGWNCRCVLLTLFEEYEPIEPDLIDGGMPVPDPGFATNPTQLLGV